MTEGGPVSGATILTTARLRLRAAREDDIAVLQARVFGDAQVMRHAFAGRTLTDAEAAAFIRAHFTFAVAPIGLAVLEETVSGEVIGFAGLNPCDALGADDLEIGFVLARAAWGKGFAREIGAAQLALGFMQLRRPRLLALAAPGNVASLRVLEKLGMQPVSDVTPEGRALRRVFCRLAPFVDSGQ
jgi:RimJ/RimL family protein N-acetyltransferase